MTTLKPYIAYPEHYGPHHAAALVLATSVREAKRLAWRRSWLPDECDGWTDLAVRLFRPADRALPLADQDKLAAGIPHVVESPAYCQSCEQWGCGVTEDGRCCHCNEYPGDELVGLFGGQKEEAGDA
jgi:hypothetical protein